MSPRMSGLVRHRLHELPGLVRSARYLSESARMESARPPGRCRVMDTPMVQQIRHVDRVPAVSLVPSDHPAWSQMLTHVPHDFYHLPAYAETVAREEGGAARALHVTDGARRLLVPLIVREVPGGGRDASSPYGYPSPLMAPGHDEGFFVTALRAACNALASQGYVSLFVRMHPLLLPMPPPGVGEVVQHEPTVAIDLSLSQEAWRAGLRKSHRRQIARAITQGHRASIDDSWRHFDTFKSLYRFTMRRLGASEKYRFSDNYFDDLREALGESLALCVIECERRVWAAGLFVETEGIVQSHLSADDGTCRHGGAKKLMYAHVRDWARERGNRWFHLGGGTSDSGLLDFKKGFSSDVRPFSTLRVILLRDEYERLVSAHEPATGPHEANGYFPAYRREGCAPK